MALLDRCFFHSNTNGTSDFTVGTAVIGYMTPATAGAVNTVTYSYTAQSTDLSQWEIGTGAYNSSTTILQRTTILFSSSSNSKVNFASNPVVFITALIGDFTPSNSPKTISSSTYTVDSGTLQDTSIICNNAAGITLTLPTPLGKGRQIIIKTIAAGAIISASSNVVPLIGGSAGTAILSNSAGKWCVIIDDAGTSAWDILMAN